MLNTALISSLLSRSHFSLIIDFKTNSHNIYTYNIYISVYICVYICVHECVHIYVYIYIYYIYKYMYIYIYIVYHIHDICIYVYVSILLRDCYQLFQRLFQISVIQREPLNLSVDRMYSIVALSIQTFLIATNDQSITKAIFILIKNSKSQPHGFSPNGFVFRINIMSIGGRYISYIRYQYRQCIIYQDNRKNYD